MGLGAILKGALNFIPGIGPAIGAIGDIAGGAAEGGAQGRLQEYLAQLEGERVAMQRAGQAKEFEGTDQRRMLINDLLGRMENLNIDAPFLPSVKTSGGLGASALSPEARQALTTAAGAYRGVMPGAARDTTYQPSGWLGGITKKAMANSPEFAAKLNAKNAARMGGPTVGVVRSPAGGQMPQAGAMDKLMSILGGVGSFGGALGATLPQSPQRPGGNPATLNTTFAPPAPKVSFLGRK